MSIQNQENESEKILSILNLAKFFAVNALSDLQFAHSVNNLFDLAHICKLEGRHVVEGDIILDKKGMRIVMAHPPIDDNALGFVTWIRTVVESGKCAKLDFKDPEVVREAMETVAELDPEIPVIVNADVFKGPGGGEPLFDAESFVNTVQEIYPKSIISLGWTTQRVFDDGSTLFSKAMVRQMSDFLSCLEPACVTVCVREMYLRDSWENLQILNEDRDTCYITVWSGYEDPADSLTRQWTLENMDPLKTMYDLNDKHTLLKLVSNR